MARIGTVTGIENAKDGVFVIINGIGKIEDGQRLRFEKDSWTVVKKRWVKGNDASFLLKSLTNKIPEIGQKLELVIDNLKYTIEGGHVLDVVDCFMLAYKSNLIYAVTLYGLAELKPNDIISNTDGASWKILETSMTVTSGSNRRFMVLVEALDDSQLLPAQGTKVTKTSFDEEPKLIQETADKIESKTIRPKKPSIKKTKPTEN